MCRMFLIGLVTVAFTHPVSAQDRKPTTLTLKEIADGWILLFDGETTFGWKGRGPGGVGGGEWILGGEVEAAIESNTHLGDGVIAFEYRNNIGQKREAELMCQGNPVGLLAVSDKSKWLDGYFVVREGKLTRVLRSKALFQKDSTYPVKTKELSRGPMGFVIPPGSQLALRNIKFRPDTTQSLFTGKDLTGWKIFPGKKSEFAVIDGAINIKDGPGDLQTEKQFGDFLLQLDCISHGEHLNSGVFFRCRPNEYQNGYEAQVRNQFTEKPTQKYLLEEYDPETHKLLGKKEAMFTAVDFGTGAIYRRQPARKEMSKDKEWLSMTVVAHGNHFATWVNGVQVTDWYDHRARSDNARTGCRLEAGHISLQGHDPTTNLSFKNFRIQEYPAK